LSFNDYDRNYQAVVQDSVAFTGLAHDYFLDAKVAALRRLFAAHFGEDRPQILDVGCGVGLMHAAIAPLASSLTGADPSRACIERARERHPIVSYATMEQGQLPFPDAHFDVTLAVCVFHHVKAEERGPLMSEMARVTRAGGLGIIIEHNPFNPLTRLAVMKCPFDVDAVLLSAWATNAMLRQAEYHSVNSEHILLLPTQRFGAPKVEKLFKSFPLGAQYLSWGIR
jgi:ubiquinone/menaquinone biosynthesis C-methylase UbiE